MRRRSLLLLCRFLIGALLFGQVAVAAYACPKLAAAGMDMVATSSATLDVTVSDAAALPDLEQHAGCAGMNGDMDPSSANLCAEHCRYGQQSDHVPSPAVPVVLLATLYLTAPLLPPVAPSHGVAAATRAMAAAFPPHAILHCCFRI